MAIIYSYPVASAVEAGDLLIGTDITGKQTKNFSVGSIVAAGIPSYIVGTTNTIPVFTGSNTIGDSIIIQDSGANGVGIGGNVENNRKLKVHGHSSVDGNLYLSGDASSYSVEVGQSRSVEGVALLDLTGEIMPDDYGLRLIRYGGENAESAIIHTGTSNLRIRTENSADTVFENTKVGIGVAAPQRELDVNGGIRVRGPLDLFQQNDNTFAGTNAGNFYNVLGNSNAAFGEDALAAITSASRNTAVGFESLKENISGNNNTAIGTSSMALSTAGSFNTALGNSSLSAATTGQGNTAIGNAALTSKTTSNFNTAVGHNSLSNITTGFRNTAVGNEAGRFTSDGTTANSTGRNSIFIGDSAKASADNQTNEIVIGVGAVGNGSNTITLGNDDIALTKIKGNVEATSLTIADSLEVGLLNSVSGTNGLTSGNTNSVLGNDSVAFGFNNSVSGNRCGGLGANNIVAGGQVWATGDGNDVGIDKLNVGGNIVASGFNNTVKSGSSCVVGTSNILTNTAESSVINTNFVMGSSNALNDVADGIALGFNNTINNDNSCILGKSNTINASDSYAIGKGNTLSSDDDYAFGLSNTISGSATIAMALGHNNVLSGNQSYAFGRNLEDGGEDNTVIIGRYNATPTATGRIVFGTGFSTTGRKNAIEIQSGTSSQSGLLFPALRLSNSYNNDSDAAAAGVERGELYRSNNQVRINIEQGPQDARNNEGFAYLTPQLRTASAGTSSSISASYNLVLISWTGGNGVHTLNLPLASANANRLIRITTDGTLNSGAGDKINITATGGETIDGDPSFQISKSYEGVAVYSTGSEWIVIQAKAH